MQTHIGKDCIGFNVAGIAGACAAVRYPADGRVLQHPGHGAPASGTVRYGTARGVLMNFPGGWRGLDIL